MGRVTVWIVCGQGDGQGDWGVLSVGRVMVRVTVWIVCGQGDCVDCLWAG